MDPRDAALMELGIALQALGYRFVTPTPATIERVTARPAKARAQTLHDVFGWNRPFAADLLPPALHATMARAGIVRQHADGLRSALRVSSIGEQLFFHSSYPTDDKDAVFFGPDTYRFVRAVQAGLDALATPPARCIDIGCGAGAGAALLAQLLPQAHVIGSDINERALALTRVNAALAGVQVLAMRSDLLADVPGQFDLIIANPPYLVDDSERSYRHGGGELGSGLSLAIVDAAIERLAPGGTLMLYTASAIVGGRDALREAAGARLQRAGLDWHYEEIDPDVFGEELLRPAYAQVDRLAAVCLQACRR